MQTSPGRGKLKPHLRKMNGRWVVLYADPDGVLFSVVQITASTRRSKAATATRAWAAERNAAIIKNVKLKLSRLFRASE